MSESEKLSILSSVIVTRNLILRSFCGIYLCAFLSFYIQAEGEPRNFVHVFVFPVVIDTCTRLAQCNGG